MYEDLITKYKSLNAHIAQCQVRIDLILTQIDEIEEMHYEEFDEFNSQKDVKFYGDQIDQNLVDLRECLIENLSMLMQKVEDELENLE